MKSRLTKLIAFLMAVAAFQSCSEARLEQKQKQPRLIFPQSATSTYLPQIFEIPALFDSDCNKAFGLFLHSEILLQFSPIETEFLSFQFCNGYQAAGDSQYVEIAKEIDLWINDSVYLPIKLAKTTSAQLFEFQFPKGILLSSLKITGKSSYPADLGESYRKLVWIGDLSISAISLDSTSNRRLQVQNFLPAPSPNTYHRGFPDIHYSDCDHSGIEKSKAELKQLRPTRLFKNDLKKLLELLEGTAITKTQLQNWALMIAQRESILGSPMCMESDATDLYDFHTQSIKIPPIANCGKTISETVLLGELSKGMREGYEGLVRDTLPGRVLLNAKGLPQQQLSRDYAMASYPPQAYKATDVHDQILAWNSEGLLIYELELRLSDRIYGNQQTQLENAEQIIIREFFHTGFELDSVLTLSLEYDYEYEAKCHVWYQKFSVEGKR